MADQLKYYQVNKKTKSLIELLRCNLTFRSISSLKSYTILLVRNILDEDVNEGHPRYDFFCDMIDRHYEIKYERGMIFVVHTNAGYNLDKVRSRERTPYRRSEPYRSYVYIPSFKKWRSFSLFNKCVNGKNYSERTLKNREYRDIVEPQIQSARRKKKWFCELCGDTKMLDIDHHPKKFSQIVKEYEEQKDIDNFFEYHASQASYRILCCECHKKEG